MVTELNEQNVTPEALSEKGWVLVDFWAPWCGPCRMMGPVVEKISETFSGRVTVGKLNIDENADAALSYGVQSIPTLILFKDGVEKERFVGARNQAAMAKALEDALGA